MTTNQVETSSSMEKNHSQAYANEISGYSLSPGVFRILAPGRLPNECSGRPHLNIRVIATSP
jgi:hypothetical protein